LSKSIRMDLPDTPGLFTFAEQMVFGKVKFKAKKDREEGGEESKELDVREDLQEIRAAVWEMDTKMRHVVEGLHVNQVGMTDHLWKFISCFAAPSTKETHRCVTSALMLVVCHMSSKSTISWT
jgi:hypothetical protein